LVGIAFQQCGYLFVLVGVFVGEAEVLQLCLDAVKTQSVGQRRVQVHGFTRNLVLFAGQHDTQGAHVVETVGHLDEHHPDVFRHGKQEAPEVFRLG